MAQAEWRAERRHAARASRRPDGARAHEGEAATGLTARQVEVLLHCADSGYYEIPRRRTLRALAEELGISATSLSLLLRRAEARLVHAFASGQEREPKLPAEGQKPGQR